MKKQLSLISLLSCLTQYITKVQLSKKRPKWGIREKDKKGGLTIWGGGSLFIEGPVQTCTQFGLAQLSLTVTLEIKGSSKLLRVCPAFCVMGSV